jgi:hypothetical protein
LRDHLNQRLDDKSRMSREVHVRFCEGLEVRFLGATRLREGPEVSSFEIIRAEAANCPVTVLCKLLEVSTSGYYAHLARNASE